MLKIIFIQIGSYYNNKFIRMKGNRNKQKQKNKEKLTDKFKHICMENTKRQPPIYLMSFIREKNIEFDVDSFQSDDIVFLYYMFQLPITKIHIFSNPNAKKSPQARPFYHMPKFKEFIKLVGKAIEQLQTIKSLIFQKIPISIKVITILKEHIQLSARLRELVMKDCSLTDEHMENMKGVLAENQSLVIVDFSSNLLNNVGAMIGKILSQHSRRRNDIVWIASLRGQKPQEDLSKKGICEINLQSNQISDRSAQEMINFLKDDNWTKCINLRNNKLTQEGIKSFALLLKKNTSLISLDLRENVGFTKQYSLYIFKKLKKNLQKYKEQKKQIIANSHKDITMNSGKNGIQYKSLEQSRRKSLQPRTTNKSNAKLQYSLQNNILPKNNKNITSSNEGACQRCKENTFRLLKVEKKNLDLRIELRKLKHILLNKNIDISAIIPNTSILHSSLSFHRTSLENDDEMLMRMEQIMMELTKIMETVEGQQQTQINMTNPLSNANSLSNTIPIFVRPEELQELEMENSLSEDQQHQ